MILAHLEGGAGLRARRTRRPSMHKYVATVSWHRNGEPFTDNRYSRVHEWKFDCGLTLAASASPQVVPPPMSSASAVDPEEALIAAASSCHMLSFLYVAARQ